MGWMWGTFLFLALLIVYFMQRGKEQSTILERDTNYFRSLCRKTNARLEVETMNRIWYTNGHDFDAAFRQTRKEMIRKGFVPCVPYSFYYRDVKADYSFLIYVHRIDHKEDIDLPFSVHYGPPDRIEGNIDNESVSRLHEWCQERANKYPLPEKGVNILGKVNFYDRRFDSEVVEWRKLEYEFNYPKNTKLCESGEPIPTVEEYVYGVRPWPEYGFCSSKNKDAIPLGLEQRINSMNMKIPAVGSTAFFPEFSSHELLIRKRRLGEGPGWTSYVDVTDCVTGKQFVLHITGKNLKVLHSNPYVS